MQIGTSYSYDHGSALLRSLSDRAASLQTTISLNQRIQTPSDDPVAAARIAVIDRKLGDMQQYSTNITLASALIAQSDSALESVQTQLQRARELAMRAASDTMNDGDRAAISAELNGIVDDLFAIVNQRDARDTPLFGGTGTGDAFVRGAGGTVSYAGTGTPPAVPISATGSIAATDAGDKLFGGISVNGVSTDMFAILTDLAAALAPGGTPDAATLRARIEDGLAGLGAADTRVATARASFGARGARLDLESERLATATADAKVDRTTIDGFDLQDSVVELQQMMLTLQASQASFSRLTQLSLFDYLR